MWCNALVSGDTEPAEPVQSHSGVKIISTHYLQEKKKQMQIITSHPFTLYFILDAFDSQKASFKSCFCP